MEPQTHKLVVSNSKLTKNCEGMFTFTIVYQIVKSVLTLFKCILSMSDLLGATVLIDSAYFYEAGFDRFPGSFREHQ